MSTNLEQAGQMTKSFLDDFPIQILMPNSYPLAVLMPIFEAIKTRIEMAEEGVGFGIPETVPLFKNSEQLDRGHDD